MKHLLIFAMLTFGLVSCGSEEKEREERNRDEMAVSNEKDSSEFPTDFDYAEFIIRKGQLGDIRIGMTVSEAEAQFSGLSKEEEHAFKYGFDGGSPAYSYYSGDSLIFSLIPKLNTDTVLFIVAASPRLKTTNGLYPKATVKEIMEVYPDMKVKQNLLSGGEFFTDTINNWTFVFLTDEETRIGEYPEPEVPSRPQRLEVKSDWISIK